MATTISKNTKAYGQQILDIKNRVKSEFARRYGRNTSTYEGSVSKYSGPEYDYSTKTSNGSYINTEHINKIVEPINAISYSGVEKKSSGNKVLASDLITLEQNLSLYESKDAQNRDTGCNTSCTGLCYGSCNTGCSYTCFGGCGDGCSGGCRGGCAGCTGTCSVTCGQDCSAACMSNCYGCTGSCIWGCYTTCTAPCQSSGPV